MTETPITQEFLARLKKLAKRATQGAWIGPEYSNTPGYAATMRVRDNGGFVRKARKSPQRDIAYFVKWQDAHYFTALTPNIVLAMIEKLEEAGV